MQAAYLQRCGRNGFLRTVRQQYFSGDVIPVALIIGRIRSRQLRFQLRSYLTGKAARGVCCEQTGQLFQLGVGGRMACCLAYQIRQPFVDIQAIKYLFFKRGKRNLISPHSNRRATFHLGPIGSKKIKKAPKETEPHFFIRDLSDKKKKFHSFSSHKITIGMKCPDCSIRFRMVFSEDTREFFTVLGESMSSLAISGIRNPFSLLITYIRRACGGSCCTVSSTRCTIWV